MKRIMSKQEVIDAILKDTSDHVEELNLNDVTLGSDIVDTQGVLSITLTREIESNGGSISTEKKGKDADESYGYCDKMLRNHYEK